MTILSHLERWCPYCGYSVKGKTSADANQKMTTHQQYSHRPSGLMFKAWRAKGPLVCEVCEQSFDPLRALWATVAVTEGRAVCRACGAEGAKEKVRADNRKNALICYYRRTRKVYKKRQTDERLDIKARIKQSGERCPLCAASIARHPRCARRSCRVLLGPGHLYTVARRQGKHAYCEDCADGKRGQRRAR